MRSPRARSLEHPSWWLCCWALGGMACASTPPPRSDASAPDASALDAPPEVLDVGALDAASEAADVREAEAPCGDALLVGTSCTLAGRCELGRYQCVDAGVLCVGTGAPAGAGTMCRASAGPCDVAESCDGASLACPADSFAAPTTLCRPSATNAACDPVELCTGSSAACPPDAVLRAPTKELCNGVDDDCDGAVDGSAAAAACGLGATCAGGRCLPVPPPRLLAPLSTAAVSSRRPTFRWALGEGAEGARVQLCRDRACSDVLTELVATGTSARPSAELPAGVLFWRARGRTAGSEGTATSATWQLVVGARSAAGPDTSWGSTLDVNGDGYSDLAVGAWTASSNAGRVHLYLGSAAGLASAPSLSLSGPDGALGNFGFALASAGDLNGDGFADLAVGAYGVAGNTGRVHVYLGSAAGLSGSPALTLASPDGAMSYFGASVAGVGDLDGDGYADLAVGALGALGNTGRVHLYLGGATGLASTPAASLLGPDGANSFFGFAVSSAGDLNGDGYADLAVGALGAARPTDSVHLFHGSARGVASAPTLSLLGPGGGVGNFGAAVACAGDVDGDGYADLAVGAYGSNSNTGRVHLFRGGAAGLSPAPTVSLDGPEGAGGYFGAAVASAGDVDNDGYADLAVGAYGVGGNTGRVHLFRGGAAGLGTTPALSLMGPDGAGAHFGEAVSGLGDTNGDGYGDLAVGAYGVSGNAGRAYVHLGNAAGLLSAPSLSLSGPDGASGSFGRSLAGR